jgi:hypothetical protein
MGLTYQLGDVGIYELDPTSLKHKRVAQEMMTSSFSYIPNKALSSRLILSRGQLTTLYDPVGM